MNTTTRNANLTDLVEILKSNHARKHDLVVPASKIQAQRASLVVTGSEPEITLDGVTNVDGTYVPTDVCDEGISNKLNIPRAYLRRMRDTRPDLYDANVNGWLHGTPENAGPDGRSFLLRTFKGEDGDPGIARAFLSDTYRMIDDLDVLMAVLDGVRAAGVNASIDGGDLTERRMRVRIRCEEISALAPTLLAGYRSPFTGNSGDENPVIFAGLEIANSEVGAGAMSITPRIIAQVCNNGMTITRDALRNVHLGGRMEEGVINWSDETQRRSLELVQSKTKDAVATFLNIDYLTQVIAQAEEKAIQKIDTIDQVKDVTKSYGFTDDQVNDVLSHFITGGQMNLGGVSNAMTSVAQITDDAEVAADLEAAGAGVLL